MKTVRRTLCEGIVMPVFIILYLGGGAMSAEINVMSAGAVKAAVTELAKEFQRETGHGVTFTFATVGALQQKITAGERADLFIMSDTAIEDLIKKGVVVSGSKTDIARVGIGVAVREGTPLPDISTPEALKKTLLSARSLVYMDPSKGGSSGIHFAKVVDQMGIADALKDRTVLWPSGYAAEALLKGEAEICVHQISEILAVRGVALVGPLPSELQKVTRYSAGLVTGAASPDAAKAFIRFLTAPSARSKFSAVGLDYTE